MIIHDMEQGTPEWFKARLGLPTASELSRIVTSTGQLSKSCKEYACEIAAERFFGMDEDAFPGNHWTERGKELEPEAIAAYEFLTGYEVKRIGFITDDKKLLGASPDILVNDNGLGEVKCLKRSKILMAKVFCEGRVPPSNYAQVQGQLFVSEREWTDWIPYHPDIPLETIRTGRDEKFITNLDKALEEFHGFVNEVSERLINEGLEQKCQN
jgi:hypothetical protein